MKNILKKGLMVFTMFSAMVLPFALLNNNGAKYVDAPKIKLRMIDKSALI